MGLPVTNFRSELDPVVRKELDTTNAELTEFLSAEHHEDGTHADVTADSITTGPLTIHDAVDLITLEADLPSGKTVDLGTLTVATETTTTRSLLFDMQDATHFALDKSGVRQIDFGVSAAAGLSPNEQQVSGSLATMGRGLLQGQGVYTPSANDAAAFTISTFGPEYSYWRATPGATRTIDGIYCLDVTNGARGQVIEIVNDSAFVLTFRSTVVSSARRLYLPNGLPIAIAPLGTIRFIYDNTNLGWRFHGCTGQDWIDVAFDAANFSGSGAQTWTLASADQVQFAYLCVGKTMTVSFVFDLTTVGGTPDTYLTVKIPGGQTAARDHYAFLPPNCVDNGTPTEAFARVIAGETIIRFARADVANWAASTNATVIVGQITFSIQ